MPTKQLTIKTASLSNNCPECYSSTGLKLTFKQIFKETTFYKSMTKKITKELKCSTCGTTIYPARWTNEIDQVVNYHEKILVLKPQKIKLKTLAWVVMISIDFMILVLILYSLGVFDQL
jgi:hypothetical protein